MKKMIHQLKYGWKLFLLLSLTIAVFCYAMFQGGFVSWFLFYSFLPFSCYSLILFFYPLHTFQVSRSINQEQFSAGETLIAKITIHRKFPFPLFYLIVEDILPYKLNGNEFIDEPKKLLFPSFKKTIEYEYELLNIPRGEHIFKTIRLKTGDLFSLTEKEVFFHVENYFLVYPSYVDLDYRKQTRDNDQGHIVSNKKLWQETTMTIGVRDYQHGDRFSSIDWKATARRGSMMTKEFEQMQSNDVIVTIDRSQSEKFEWIVTFTASILRSLIKNGENVGLVSIGADKMIFPLQSTEKHLQDMFYHLAKVDCDSKESFVKVLTENRNWNERKVTDIIVTSYLTVELVKKLEYLSHYSLYVIKKLDEQTTAEEHVLLEQLRKQQSSITVIYEDQYDDTFKEVGDR